MKKEDGIYAMRFASQQMLIDKLKQENKQLKDNWNKLKEYLHNQIPTDKTVLTKHIKIFEVLDIMQEIEQESDSNDSN